MSRFSPLILLVCTGTSVVAQESSPAALAFADRSELLSNPTLASGVALGVVDMNQDGRDDIIHFDRALDLSIDYQGADGSFLSNSLGRVSDSAQWGLAIGDTDNNGFPDLISGGFFDGLHYLRANSDGSAYSSQTLSNPTIYLQAVNFVDIDNDGWLDLFPCHDLGNNPPFRNDGAGSLSHDPSLINTRTATPSDNSGNYGSVWTDYDSDGDLDLYISKCKSGVTDPTDPRRINQLFQNDGAGNFSEVAATAGLNDGRQSWTTDFADIDNDGDLDCFIGNHLAPSRLMINDGNGVFAEETTARGLTVGWNVIQAIFRDFDNDGWIDLLLTGSEHALWLNDRDGTFTKTENVLTDNFIESAAVGDLNRDGFVDIYAGYARLFNAPRPERPDRLLLNEANDNNFVSITLLGRDSNRLASGAQLELHGPWGTQVREVRSGEGYAVTHSFTQIFGMGPIAQADKLVVRWPSGRVDTALDIAANQFLTLTEGDTTPPTLVALEDRTSLTGAAVSLPVLATDPDGNPLTFSASNLPPGLTIDSASGVISGTTSLASGDFSPIITVSDGWSQISDSFSWTIQARGDDRGLSFPLSRVAIPGRLQAEDYDTGGAGVSYSDRDSSNLGGIYREDGVDLVASADSDGTPAVSWIENGESLNYSIILASGTYDFVARVAAPTTSPGAIRVWLDERELGIIGVPRTASWQTWASATLPAITITGEGPATIRLEFVGSTFSLNWIDVLPSTSPPTPANLQRPFLGRALPIPGRIEAEYYDLGGPGVAYQDNEEANLTNTFRSEGVDLEFSADEDNSTSLSFFDDGEWLEYTLTARPGRYDITLRTAAGVEEPGSVRLTLDGAQIALTQTPDTNGSQSWASTTLRNIAIPKAGAQVLRVEAVGDGINLNWIDFTRVSPLPDSPPDNPLESDELLALAFGGSANGSGNPSPIIPSGSADSLDGGTVAFLTRLDSRSAGNGLANRDFRYLPRASRDLINWDLAVVPTNAQTGLPTPPQGFKYTSYRLVDGSVPRAFFRIDIDAQ